MVSVRAALRRLAQSQSSLVVAQLVELSLLIPEVRDSNPVIGKNLHIEHLFIYCQLY